LKEQDKLDAESFGDEETTIVNDGEEGRVSEASELYVTSFETRLKTILSVKHFKSYLKVNS
jgi:hypothetical protein